MSIANSTIRAATAPPDQDLSIYRCETCEGHYPHSGDRTYGLNRRFCRLRCKYLNIADSLLKDVKHDHRHCASCYRQLKEVEPPAVSKKSAELGRSPPDCATGKQTYHDHCEHDLRDDYREGEPTDGRVFPSVDLRERMTCECPANHHSVVRELPSDAEWTKREAIKHTKRLVDVLDNLDERGVHSTDFDAGVLFGFVRKAKSTPSAQGRDDREVLRRGLSLAIQEAP